MQTQNTKALSVAQGWSPSLQNVKTLYSTTKPNIVALTLVAALTGIYVGNRGIFPEWSLIGWTLFCLALATAGACMLNNLYDRDIDKKMKRTQQRAIASGEISSQIVLPISLALSIFPVILMAYVVNPATAIVTGSAVFGYAVVYTMIAKRRTPWANQLGGIAGALPPVVGYVAVTGQIDIYAFLMFFIMAVWQQPHALSLALKYREDYARADVPVIPVVHGVHATKVRILLYSLLLIPVSTLPYFFGLAGEWYLVTSVVFGVIFSIKSAKFLASNRQYDMRLFLLSLVHFIVMFSVLMVDIQFARVL